MRVIIADGGKIICELAPKEFQSITGYTMHDGYGNFMWQEQKNIQDKIFDLTKMIKAHENVEKLFLLRKNLASRFNEINAEMEKIVFPFSPTEKSEK